LNIHKQSVAVPERDKINVSTSLRTLL